MRQHRTGRISEDIQCDLDNHRKYCIILEQLSQAELLFPAGCYFYTLFAICDVANMHTLYEEDDTMYEDLSFLYGSGT